MVEDGKMKIDITGSNVSMLMDLMNKFPSGTVSAEGGKAFWEWDGQIQQITQPVNFQAIRQQPQQQNTFLKMFDSMASYF